MELNKIHQGDCLQLLKQLDDESVDLIITDPPYGDGIGYGRMDKTILNNESEEINYKVLPILYSKLKRGGVAYLFTNWKFSPLIQDFIKKQTQFNIRMELVVVKNNIGMGYGFRNQHEFLLVLEKGDVKYNRNDVSSVLKMGHIHHDKDTHPHEKGLDLLKLLIDHSSKEGDLVLDCFAGSGSTLVACQQTKRKFIGMELDEKWFNLADTRLKSVTGNLF